MRRLRMRCVRLRQVVSRAIRGASSRDAPLSLFQSTNNKDIPMLGRREFGIAGLSAVALAAVEGSALAQGKTKPKAKAKGDAHHAEHDEMLQACAKACSDCQRACDTCSTHCAHLLAEGEKAHLTTLATCQDCADFCAAASQIVARGGPFSALICESCADACARCGEACEKFPDDAHMKMCAEECRKCEKACKAMVQHAGHAKH